jgi:hypothetical protein
MRTCGPRATIYGCGEQVNPPSSFAYLLQDVEISTSRSDRGGWMLELHDVSHVYANGTR